MKVATTTWAVVGLLLAIVGPVGGVAAGTKDTTIFVANLSNVTAYPAGSKGDVAPIAVTTDMVSPSGIATDATGRIYVTNGPLNTVTVYAANANGNVPPIAVIGGSNTRLANPTAIALGADGRIYVVNGTEFPKGSTTLYSNSAEFPKGNVTVYPPLAGTGILNEAPIATIAGSKTLLDDPAGVAVDSDGNLYVANAQGNPFSANKNIEKGSVTVYRAGSSGNVTPIATISGSRTGLSYPLAIALDSSGKIFVTNTYTGNTKGSPPNSSITVYAAGSNGNAPPIAVIAGENTGLDYPQGIALDSSGNLYVEGFVSGVGSGINVYPSGSSGNVSPAASIVGADTELDLPIGVALDSGGNIYVSNGFGGPTQRGSVTVYRAGSSGDAIPINVITSNFTGINFARSIAVDSSANIYVANVAVGVSSIDIYPAGSYAAGPPVSTIAGDNTELSGPFGIALDSSGNIYVLNRGDNAIDNAITVYPAGSNGDVTPSATFTIDQSGESVPTAMAVGGSGAVYIANQGGLICNRRSCHLASADNVAVYGAGSDGSTKPIAVISGRDTKLASPSAIAVDHSGAIYVTNQGPLKCKCAPGSCSCFNASPGTVTVYPPASNGNVAPVAMISGPNTGIGSPYGITLDSSGNICVLNDRSVVGIRGKQPKSKKGVVKAGTVEEVEYGPKVDPVLIFARGSNGDIAPITALGGPFTGLFGPTAIAVGPTVP